MHEKVEWPPSVDESKAPTALGCYIYAGGFSIGVSQHFKVLGHFEDGNFGVPTVKRNFGREFPVFTKPEDWPVELYQGRVNFLYGNPPCAPWSMAGVQPRRNRDYDHVDKYKQDPRVSCVYNLYGLLDTVQPAVWAWESVQGAYTRGKELVHELTAGALDRGYSASFLLFNGADLGTPQSRRRFFGVFHKVEIDWDYPTEIRHVTPVEAWHGLPLPDPEDVFPHGRLERALLPDLKQGEGIRGAWERWARREYGGEDRWPRNGRGHIKGRPAWQTFRLSEDKLAGTHIGGVHQYHPTEDRYITVAEAKRLAGYPDNYEIVESSMPGKFVVMFRAVLPHAGAWLARNVRRGLDRGLAVKSPRATLHDFEKNIHREERVE